MLPLLLAAWTAWAAPEPADAVTARLAPPLRAVKASAEPVRVVVEGVDAKALAAAVGSVPGAHVEIAVDDEVQLTVPASGLRALAGLRGVTRVRPPFAAFEYEVTSEGVDRILLSDWHALGITGAGIKIAVLDTGFAGYESRIAEGELPATVGFVCYRADQPACASSNHGTAVAEIVHDFAPDAQLTLIGAYLSSEWRTAADAIKNGDYDIVTSSMGFGNFEPIDGDNSYAKKLDAAVGTTDLLWFQAAGNLNPATWTGIVTDDDNDQLLEMAGQEEIPLLFDGNGTTGAYVDVRWDDPWGGANDDIDLLLVARDSGGADVAIDLGTCSWKGTLPQTGSSTHTPWERMQCPLPGNVATIALKLQVKAGTGAGHRVWLMNYADLDPAWVTDQRSISIPSDARKAIAVGAVGSTPGDDVVRHYSGRGPTDDGRTKPDLVGPSTGATVSRPTFNGTSAATPHLAGLAALVLQDVRDAGGDLSREEVLAWIDSQSADLGPAGADNDYGWGLPQLDTPWSDSVDTGTDTGDTGTDTADTGTDTGTDTSDTDTGGDTDTDSGDTDTGDLPDLKSCQCATGSPSPGLLPVLLLALPLRRRRRG